GVRRAMASARPSAWFSIPARPSLTAQTWSGSADWNPADLTKPPRRVKSEELHLDDFVRLCAARGHDFHHVAFFLADQRAGDRGGDGDLAFGDIALVFADDLVL